ncbi:MAG TPA: CBS domain-containing protein [archaeon]|nr:CBS domain-containing protein [archaeon]
MKVSEIMTKDPVTAKQTDTIGDIVRLLTKHKISGVPVTSRNKLVGVVTQTDVIGAIDVYKKVNKSLVSFEVILSLLESEDKKIKLSIGRMMKTKIGKMKKKVVSVDVEEDIYKSAALINMHGIDRLPVTKNGKLVGIITKTDIILALEKWGAD